MEAFVWDPLMPIAMMTNNYGSVTELTIPEAKRLRKALKKTIQKAEGK